MGANTQTSQQSQNQTSNPWAPTIPGLTNIIGQLTGQSTAVTPGQSSAVSNLQGLASSLPGFGPQAATAVGNMFNTSTAPQQAMLQNAYNTGQSTLAPMLSSNYTNPMTAPGIGTALSDLNRSITNQVTGMWSGSGRDPSGSPVAARNLAQGLAAGEAPVLTNEFNTLTGNQLGAENALINQAGATASGLTGQQQIPLTNALQGMSAAGMMPGLWTQPATTALQGANIGYQLPYEDIQQLLGPLAGIAGLGGQMAGTSSGTVSQPVNPWTTGAGIGLGLLALSDERLKDDIRPIGLLYNGLPFYSYRFKGDPQVRTGVMAQDVEQVMPEAVHEIGLWPGGPRFKAVDYARATAPTAMSA